MLNRFDFTEHLLVSETLLCLLCGYFFGCEHLLYEVVPSFLHFLIEEKDIGRC